MDSKERYAIYFIPQPDEALWAFGSRVLGYDSYTGLSVNIFDQLKLAFPGWRNLVDGPRRYGFHATLKAPFRLAAGRAEHELLHAVHTVAATLPVVSLGSLSPAALGAYIALRPRQASANLVLLEATLVTRLDEFRSPLTATDFERREPHKLTEHQRERLLSWGYPYCLDQFRFHMTLAGPLREEDQQQAISILTDLFREADDPCRITSVAVMKQRVPEKEFRVLHQFELRDEA